MSFFTHKQSKALKQILEGILEDGKNQESIALIEENNLMAGFDKDLDFEYLKEDVMNVIDEKGYDHIASNGDAERIAHTVRDLMEIDEDLIEEAVDAYDKYMREEDYTGEIVFRYFY